MLPRINGVVIENRNPVLDLLKGGFSIDVVKSPEKIDIWVPAIVCSRQFRPNRTRKTS